MVVFTIHGNDSFDISGKCLDHTLFSGGEGGRGEGKDNLCVWVHLLIIPSRGNPIINHVSIAG